MKPLAALLAFSLPLALGPSALAQDIEPDVIAIPKLVQLCESCHGPKGISEREDVPSLAGQSAESILADMNKFYFQRRHCPPTQADAETGSNGASLDMCTISGSLSQTEKMALAEHFAALPPPQEQGEP